MSSRAGKYKALLPVWVDASDITALVLFRDELVQFVMELAKKHGVKAHIDRTDFDASGLFEGQGPDPELPPQGSVVPFPQKPE